MHPPFSPFLDTLSRRLDKDGPLGVAVSGGGDSVALLYRLARWGQRPLHVFCVDHGLNPDSAGWTEGVAGHAREAGAAFTALRWTGVKPATGISAKARLARHALLAGAARQAGIRVLCLAHTADDVAEAAWMRANGSNVTAPAEWSPSPVWPQGRGVFLLRPLLHENRDALRGELRDQGISWIDDPANADPRSLRARARLAEKARLPADPADICDISPLIGNEWAQYGLISLHTDALSALPPFFARKILAAAVVCAGGGDRLPRGDSVEALMTAVQTGKTATLCGARIWTADGRIHMVREAGDIARHNPEPLCVSPDVEAMWDGRYAIRASRGGTVSAIQGRRDRLDEAGRRALSRLPAPLRGTLPLFDGNGAQLLGHSPPEGIDCTNWVMARFLAACGQVATEKAIGTGIAGHGQV
ncbi:MAG: tRNA lysidine(34) synthetase TilS [Asticcacaulis sp.]